LTIRPPQPDAGSPAKSLTWVVSADYARFTGGYVYNERVLSELGRSGWSVRRVVLPPGFPTPSEDVRAAAADILSSIPDGTLVLGDQICLCPVPDAVEASVGRLRLAVIAHHVMAIEDDPTAQTFADLERRVMPRVDHVVVPSRTTATGLIYRYGVDRDRISVATQGLDPVALSRGSGQGAPALLAVGALVPRKGHDVLLRALSGLTDLPWSLTIVGDAERSPAYSDRLLRMIKRAGLTGRVHLAGAVDDIEPFWDRADLFVATARHEGFGMAVAEATARGLPVLTAASGAVAEWLDPSVAAIVMEPDGPVLADELRRLLSDPVERARLGTAARAFSARLPRWSDTAMRIDDALAPLAVRGSGAEP
jgi:glycosyltransferase involved in cell wall biosynthesis